MPTMSAVSVIIPTYNRKDLLRETLNSLAQQTYPSGQFEVIVVDDGSTDGTAAIAEEPYPFTLRYLVQSNQGDAEARNLGVRQSQADILVFLDDDILVEPDYLAHLIPAHEGSKKRIVIGTWHLWTDETTSFAHRLHASSASDRISEDIQTVKELSFSDVFSNNMSLRREAYFNIGMMHGLDFPGSSMWCDLDFSYRAYKQGYEFFRSTKAICWHRDHTVRNLDVHKKRMRTAAYRAIVLFQRYPELLAHVPMFYDKTPIAWRQDPPRLIARKIARAIASSRLAIWGMEKLVLAFEGHFPASNLLPHLYRFIIGGYMFQGYRQGLHDFGQIKTVGETIRLP